jgi:hypothetical protein
LPRRIGRIWLGSEVSDEALDRRPGLYLTRLVAFFAGWGNIRVSSLETLRQLARVSAEIPSSSGAKTDLLAWSITGRQNCAGRSTSDSYNTRDYRRPIFAKKREITQERALQDILNNKKMTNLATQPRIVHQVYSTTIEVPLSPKDVFSHLIHDVRKWWPEDVEGETAKLGDEFIFRSGDSHFSRNKVIELVADQRVVWLVTESIRKTDNFEWTGTKMIYEITPSGDNSLIQYTYDGPVREDEYDRLVQICDLVIKEMLYDFIVKGKTK